MKRPIWPLQLGLHGIYRLTADIYTCVRVFCNANASADLLPRDAALSSSSSSTPTPLLCVDVRHMTAELAPPTCPLQRAAGVVEARPVARRHALYFKCFIALRPCGGAPLRSLQTPTLFNSSTSQPKTYRHLLFSPPPWSLLLAQRYIALSSSFLLPSCIRLLFVVHCLLSFVSLSAASQCVCVRACFGSCRAA